MDKSELIKYLWMPVKDVPEHILEIFDEYGIEFIFEVYDGSEAFFNEGYFNRIKNIFPIEGLRLLKDFFIDFDNDVKQILKHISVSKQIDDLNHRKRFLTNCKQPISNEIFELEIKKHRPFLDDYIKRIDNELKQIQKHSPQKKTSYVWQSNPDTELPELYSLIINKYKLIASATTYEQFEAVFTGQPIGIIDKIERTKKFTNVLLTYFVSELFQKSNPNDYLSIAESCFDGAKNLSQTQNNYYYNQNRLPKNHTLIDSLLKDLQNPL